MAKKISNKDDVVKWTEDLIKAQTTNPRLEREYTRVSQLNQKQDEEKRSEEERQRRDSMIDDDKDDYSYDDGDVNTNYDILDDYVNQAVDGEARGHDNVDKATNVSDSRNTDVTQYVDGKKEATNVNRDPVVPDISKDSDGNEDGRNDTSGDEQRQSKLKLEEQERVRQQEELRVIREARQKKYEANKRRAKQEDILKDKKYTVSDTEKENNYLETDFKAILRTADDNGPLVNNFTLADPVSDTSVVDEHESLASNIIDIENEYIKRPSGQPPYNENYRARSAPRKNRVLGKIMPHTAVHQEMKITRNEKVTKDTPDESSILHKNFKETDPLMRNQPSTEVHADKKKDIMSNIQEDPNGIQNDNVPKDFVNRYPEKGQSEPQNINNGRIILPFTKGIEGYKEAIMKVRDNQGVWTKVLSTTIVLKKEKYRDFVEGDMPNFPITGAAVINRPKTDTTDIDRAGGTLKSSTNPHISVQIVKGTFQYPTSCELKVIQIPDLALEEIKIGDPELRKLVSCSSLLSFDMSGEEPKKPIIIKMPEPKVPQKKSTDLSNIPSQNSNGYSMRLMKREVSKAWVYLPDTEFQIFYSLVTFEVDGIFDKLLLLRVADDLDERRYYDIANKFDQHLNRNVVGIVMRQHARIMSKVIMECVPREQINAKKDEFARLGYTEGPEPSEEFYIQEGQIITLKINGEFTLGHQHEIRMAYNSALRTATKQFVLQKPPYAAKEYLSALAVMQIVDRSFSQHARSTSVKKRLLASTVKHSGNPDLNEITLPLMMIFPREAVAYQAPIQVFAEGAISDAFFKHLSNKLGGQWIPLAGNLMLGAAYVGEIVFKYGNSSHAQQQAAYEMLNLWYSKDERSTLEKIRALYWGLVYVKLDGLADLIVKQDKDNCIFGGDEFPGTKPTVSPIPKERPSSQSVNDKADTNAKGRTKTTAKPGRGVSMTSREPNQNPTMYSRRKQNRNTNTKGAKPKK